MLIGELVAAKPQAQLFVMYGQTEATARLSYLPPDKVLEKLGSIGRGIPGVELRIVDEFGAPYPPASPARSSRGVPTSLPATTTTPASRR